MTDQLFVGQLQQKVEELKTEYDLQRSIKDNAINARIQRSRDKICEILRRVQGRRPKLISEQSEDSLTLDVPDIPQPYVAQFNEEVLQRRHYIFQFKMYLRRKRERQQREQEFKLLRLLDTQTEALQRWVTKDQNDNEMFDFFYTQIDPNRKGQVHHLQVKNFLFENPLIMGLFQFDRNSLQLALDSYPVKERFHLSQAEFMGFLQKYQIMKPEPGFKQYIHLFDPTYQSVNIQDNSPRILLLQSANPMKEAFEKVSENGMALVDNAIKQIRQDCNLFENAVHIVDLGLNLLLESMLQLIEIEYLNYPDQMLSWNQFLNFFDNLPNTQEVVSVPESPTAHSSASSDDYFYEMIRKPSIEQLKPMEKKPRISPPRKPLNEVNVEKMVFTVPKPLAYEKREKDRSPGIRERWVMEQVRQKQEEIEEAFKFKPFKAKPIPFKVKDKNYYQELLDREDIRRRELKARCQERTLQTQKPFKFEERQKVKVVKEVEEETTYKFRANPIPWYCSLKMYERNIMEQKVKSDNRKKIRKFWLQQNSKLPPRMQEWLDKQQLKEQERMQEKLLERPKSTSPRHGKARTIPDFKKLYEKFQKEMDKKKNHFVSTQPKGPKFHESKRKVQRDYLDEKPNQKVDPMKKAQRVIKSKPKIAPRSTEKFNAYVDRIQEKKWNEIAQLEQQFIDQQQREEKKQLFLPRVQQSWAIADHHQMLQERQQQKFIEVYQKRKQEEEDFNNMMKEIFVRVYQRPLLMEVESMKCQPQPEDEQGEQEQFDYMNPIGEQEVEESERLSQQDPEGVDQVGEQAEQSLKEYDGQEIEYGDEIDIDNIDPQLLDQLQRDALANQYGLTKEEIDYQMQKMEQSGYEEEDEEEDEDPKYLRHSF